MRVAGCCGVATTARARWGPSRIASPAQPGQASPADSAAGTCAAGGVSTLRLEMVTPPGPRTTHQGTLWSASQSDWGEGTHPKSIALQVPRERRSWRATRGDDQTGGARAQSDGQAVRVGRRGRKGQIGRGRLEGADWHLFSLIGLGEARQCGEVLARLPRLPSTRARRGETSGLSSGGGNTQGMGRQLAGGHSSVAPIGDSDSTQHNILTRAHAHQHHKTRTHLPGAEHTRTDRQTDTDTHTSHTHTHTPQQL